MFDIDLAKRQSDENPVYYVQYAHARLCSVLREWGGDEAGLRGADLSALGTPHEVALVQALAQFPEVLEQRPREFSPHLVSFFLHDELAARLHTYYNAERFLVEDEKLKFARLALVAAARQVLANGLAVLGVSAPERMSMRRIRRSAAANGRGAPAAARHDHRAAAGHRHRARGRAVAQPALSNPFVDKSKPVEPLAKIGPTQPPSIRTRRLPPRKPRPPPGAEKPESRRQAEDGSSALRVLHVLPGEKEVTEKEAKAAAARPKEPAKSGPGSSPSQPKPHTGETYWLQAGAFGEEKEADNLKAKIAFTGLEASVKPVEIPARAPCTACGWAPTRAWRTRTESRPRCPRTGSARPSSAPTKPRTD